MDIRPSLIHRVPGFWAALVLLSVVGEVSAATTYARSQTVQNNTGMAVNDLHVNTFYVPAGDAPTAPPFAPGIVAGQTLTFPSTNGAVVEAGGKVNVSWTSTRSGGGLMLLVENMGAHPVTYSDLELVNGADDAFFTPGDFVNGLLTGVPVDLLTPSGGIFDAGITQLAKLSATLLHSEYWGVSVRIDEDLFVDAGRGDVRQPPTWTLLSLGVLLLFGVRREKATKRG